MHTENEMLTLDSEISFEFASENDGNSRVKMTKGRKRHQIP